MNCDKINDILLTDFIDGLVSPDEAVKIQEHLDSCANCSAKYDQLLEFKASLHEVYPMEKAPKSLWNNIRAEIKANKREKLITRIRQEIRNIFFPENFNYRPVLAYSFIIMMVAAATMRINSNNQSSQQELKLALNDGIQSFSMDEHDLFIEGNNDFATDLEICFL